MSALTLPRDASGGTAFQSRLVPLLIVAASMALYGTALVLPAIYLEREVIAGWACLAFGWIALLVLQFAWFANPLLLAAWVLVVLRRWIPALIFAALAFGIGLHTFTLKVLPSDALGGTPVVGLGIGAYLWLSSMIVVVVGAILARYLSSLRRGNPSAA